MGLVWVAGGDVVGEVGGVLPDAPDEGGGAVSEPG